MAYDSYVQYNGDGAETDFSVTFNYLSQTVVLPPSTPAGIKVYVSDVQQTSGYTLTGSNIVFTTPPASGTNNVVIKRVTPRGHGDRLVNFAEGATLSAADLETAQLQNLYIAQEAWEQGSEDSVVTVSTTSIDAGSITATELDADCVGASELADDAVALANMGANSVGEDQIVDDSITFAHLKETDFVGPGDFTASTDTFLRFDRSTHNIVDPLSEDSQVKSADISDFHAAVKTNRLDQMAAPTAAVDLSDEKITNLATPEADKDAATKLYVDTSGGLVVSEEYNTSFTDVNVETDIDPAIITLSSLPTDFSVLMGYGWLLTLTSITDNNEFNTGENGAVLLSLNGIDGSGDVIYKFGGREVMKFVSGSLSTDGQGYGYYLMTGSDENIAEAGYGEAGGETALEGVTTESPADFQHGDMGYWAKAGNVSIGAYTGLNMRFHIKNYASIDATDTLTVSGSIKLRLLYIR